MNFTTAAFAAPSTGGAVSFRHRTSSRQPVISFRDPRGVTWSLSSVSGILSGPHEFLLERVVFDFWAVGFETDEVVALVG